MAILHTDSMLYTHPAGYYTSYADNNNGLSVQTTNGRPGGSGRWLQLQSNQPGAGTRNAGCWQYIGGTNATLMAQFGYKSITSAAAMIVFQWYDGASHQVRLVDDNGTFKVYRGQSAALLGTASSGHATNFWHQIEFKVTIDDTTGTVLLKLNGQTVINLSSQDTKATANAYANKFGLGSEEMNTNNAFGLSDVIVMDTAGSYCNDLLGIRIVKPCVPTGAGNYAEWTPSAGNNWQCVDEIPANDDTDYNLSSAVPKLDSFPVTTLPANAVVSAVVCRMHARANVGATVKGLARKGGTDGLGPAVYVLGSYSSVFSPIYVNPDTGNPFTAAEFNAAEFGYRRDS